MGEVPGDIAQQSIITRECRTNRGAMEAFDEAAERARHEYKTVIAGWGSDSDVEMRLALSVIRPPIGEETASVVPPLPTEGAIFEEADG